MGPERDGKWEFWIDRGGTFTDVIAKLPGGEIKAYKHLSEDLSRYKDAAIHGIRELMEVTKEEPIPTHNISSVRMGTTVGTNALLERNGEPCALVVNRGFRDILRIGYQNRPDIFALNIELPEMLYEEVIEINGRLDASGRELEPIDEKEIRDKLEMIHETGINSIAVVLMHSYRESKHELAVKGIAEKAGFKQISVSHEISPLMKIVGRGDTTIVDSYLSPILLRYIDNVSEELNMDGFGPSVLFMQSSGGLISSDLFRGKDCILSGPAGGIIGAVETSKIAGFDKIITFDMGGTSTDVALYNGELERSFETEVAGVRIRAPMLYIHTVAAGGGSILHFRDGRFQVGPDSAGADPGPRCYRKGGPLTVTDCNLILGRIHPDHFPRVFGEIGNDTIDDITAKEGFRELSKDLFGELKIKKPIEEIAEGFLDIAVENMSQAIKTISIRRGYDVSDYTLASFGGAGGQHACRLADSLGMTSIVIQPFSGVLSAYGMGLASRRSIRERAVEKKLDMNLCNDLAVILDDLREGAYAELLEQGVPPIQIEEVTKAQVKYSGTDSTMDIPIEDPDSMISAFSESHRERYGFIMEGKDLIVESVSVECAGSSRTLETEPSTVHEHDPSPSGITRIFLDGEYHKAPIFKREGLTPGAKITGPAVITESTGTDVIEIGWQALVDGHMNLILTRIEDKKRMAAVGTSVDPVMLEIFNKLFMSIAEQMGYSLANTAYSVNMKERLDFSCALFDGRGDLVANAPHIPVHLGSMSESVKAWLRGYGQTIDPGDVYLSNSPYNGGTHLPDVTVISPVFLEREDPVFFVASRGHHADIGGITPGSMPPDSRSIEEEGVFSSGFKIVKSDTFLEKEVESWLGSGKYPARNPSQNIADLKAQIAANKRGIQELSKMVDHYGLSTVNAYMHHVQKNAEESVRSVIDVLKDGSFEYEMDDGARIVVKVSIDHEKRDALVDLSGTSLQVPGNANAPQAVCKAGVLYVFRTLIKNEIPLNSGCLKPISISIPEGSMLSPKYPAAVAAGNVETSQYVVDTLYGALGVLAGSQGTMNNFTFGNKEHQYYETIGGGSGAGPDFNGTDGIHSHMTNTRITDPEVLEHRFPVLLEEFSIIKGTGGEGMHKGGDGIRRRIKFLENMTASILSSHRRLPPFGANGGSPGSIGRNYVIRRNGRISDIGGKGSIDVQSGDSFVIETPGGGGFGKP
jgi:5-oxoprolinase (ATP-hydrolysing)